MLAQDGADRDQDQHFAAPEGHRGDHDGEDVEHSEREISLDVLVDHRDEQHHADDDGVDDASAKREERAQKAAPNGEIASWVAF